MAARRNALMTLPETDQTRQFDQPDPATRLSNALTIPRAAPLGLPPVAPAAASPEISPRVPVHPRDFHPDDHADLHKSMGEAFDEPDAQHFVRKLYPIVRKSHPDVHPKHVLESTRDAYHAVRYGILHPYVAGLMIGHHARRRHRQAEEASRNAHVEPHHDGRGAARTSRSDTIAQPAAAIPGRTAAPGR